MCRHLTPAAPLRLLLARLRLLRHRRAQSLEEGEPLPRALGGLALESFGEAPVRALRRQDVELVQQAVLRLEARLGDLDGVRDDGRGEAGEKA